MKNTRFIWTNIGWFTKHKKPGVESRLNESPVQIEGRKAPGSISSCGKTRMPIFIIEGKEEEEEEDRNTWNLNGASIRGKRVTTGRFVLMFRSLRMQGAIQIKDFTLERHRFPIVS